MTPRHPFDLRLIVLDADGTLLTSDEQVTARTRDALAEAQARGVAIAIATGRRRSRTIGILEMLALPGTYLVASQGTAVWHDPLGDAPQMIADFHLPASSARTVLDVVRAHDLALVMLGNAGLPDIVWHDGDLEAHPTMGRYVANNRHGARPLDEAEAFVHDPTQFTILAPLNRLRDLRDDLTGRAVARDSVDRHAPRPSVLGSASRPWHVIFSRGQFTAGAALEVVGPQTNKATGVRALADYLGIEMGQIAAFGDNVNDAEILGAVGLGVAMGNATPRARAGAWAGITHRDGGASTLDRIAPSNDRDGIAWVLDHLRDGHLPPGWSPPLIDV
ncbi:MAG: HAD hydrolase family protein [Chloroflexota bacterium]|nr:Cof-type HAD-IIB family hydrolase [Chloroflexota bacterium]